MEALREIYGYKTFSGRGARDLCDWLSDQTEDARSNEDLAQRLVARCRETHHQQYRQSSDYVRTRWSLRNGGSKRELRKGSMMTHANGLMDC